MKTFEEKFTAWVDGCLEGEELAEFEASLADRPAAVSERQATLKLGEVLRARPVRLENPDFFNHQLLERIQAGERVPASARRSFLFRLAWSGAFCLLVALGVFTVAVRKEVPETGPAYLARILDARVGDASISATAYSDQENVTVLWLEGLDYLPGEPGSAAR